jgi:hypothetical protein
MKENKKKVKENKKKNNIEIKNDSHLNNEKEEGISFFYLN